MELLKLILLMDILKTIIFLMKLKVKKKQLEKMPIIIKDIGFCVKRYMNYKILHPDWLIYYKRIFTNLDANKKINYNTIS